MLLRRWSRPASASLSAAPKANPLDALQHELDAPSPSPDRIKKIVKGDLAGHIPDELRLQVWRCVLKVVPPADPVGQSAEIRNVVRDLPNQRVILVDAERTRVDLEEFRTARTHETVISLLTYYCKAKNIRYKQGLNELLAPILLLHRFADPRDEGELVEEDSEADIYATWSRFMECFVPHLFEGNGEMVPLQTAFRMLELLHKYHDPELWALLDRNDLRPELYASPWFMTLFAQSIPIAQLFRLWEALVLGDGEFGDRSVVVFVAVAFLSVNRDVFLKSDPSDLPVLLTSKLSYHHRNREPGFAQGLVLLSDALDEVLQVASDLARSTPELFTKTLLDSLYADTPPEQETLEAMESCPCVVTSPSWLVRNIAQGKAIVVDARSVDEFLRLHLIGGARGVLNISPDKLGNELVLKRCVGELLMVHRARQAVGGPVVMPRSIAREPVLHICIVGERCEGPFATQADRASVLCALHLLQYHLPCVSIANGGWPAVRQAVPPNFLATGEAPQLQLPAVVYQPSMRRGGNTNNSDDSLNFVVSRASVR